MDSPLAVTRAESAVTITSWDVGLLVNFFHGPGESPDMSGDGSGVTSDRAFSIGEETTELGAEPRFELLPTLLAKMFLILGVRAMPIVLGAAWEKSPELLAVLIALAAVIV